MVNEGRMDGVAGVDAHKQTITLAVLATTGIEVGVATFGNDRRGLQAAGRWLADAGMRIVRIGVEGTGSWGRHAAVYFAAAGYEVREVPPARTSERRRRRRRPKTDREDAVAIAREVLADDRLPPAVVTLARSAAHAELAVVSERRRSLIRRRQRLLNEAEAVLSKLPLEIAGRLRGRNVAARLRAVRTMPFDDGAASADARERIAWLCEMARDLVDWEERIATLEARLPSLLAAVGSSLTDEVGIGVVSAAELLAEVGEPRRFPSEATFARWCGTAPVAMSSGEGNGVPRRHRLDLLGNRAVNRVLHVMSVTQARYYGPARDFLARKRAEGKTPKEARRAHKRQLANRIIRRMWNDWKHIPMPPDALGNVA